VAPKKKKQPVDPLPALSLSEPDRIGFPPIPGLDSGGGLLAGSRGDDRGRPRRGETRSRTSRSYANPLNRENIKARGGAITAGYRQAVDQVQHRVIEYVRAAYRSDPKFLTNHMEIDRLTALMAPAVAAGQLQVASLTNANLAALFGLEDVPAPELSKLGRNGVDLQAELARPFWTAIKAAREGKSINDALAAGERRMEKMLSTDLQLAKTKQSREVLKASGVRTYQRVAGPNACWLCAIAATQIYFSEDLLPIHTSCGCGIAPIPPGGQDSLDRKLDPDWLLDKDASQVKLMTGMVEKDSSPADYRELIAVREHGETGPTLTWAHQKFTGPQDLPTPPSKEVLAQQAYDIVRDNGGVTISLAGNKPTDGYAYAPYKTTEFKVLKSEFSPKHIDDYIDSHHRQLSRPGNNLGMWEQDGYIFLDVSKVGPPTAETFAKAQAAHQLAVFDLGNFEEINLGTIDEKGYHRLGTPTDLHREYRRKVDRADEASRAGSPAEVPGLEGGSRRGARQSLKWTGPPVALPSYGGDIQDEVDFDWGAKKTYDKHKNAMRVAARKAQAEGYGGVPQHLRSLGRHNYEDDEIDMHGMEMVARAVHAAPSKRNLWRGVEVTPEQLADLMDSTSISLPLSAFGRDADEARLFSTDLKGRIFRSSSVPAGATDSVLFKLQPGAKLAPIFYGHEYVGFGQFDVISVKPAHWGTQGTGEYRKKIWRPTEITIKQTSMIEDVTQPIPGASALKAKSQKKIPEFTVVGKKEPQFGTIDLKTGAINRSGDYITKVQPGPIPDYDNSYAVSTQLHARHPDLRVELSSMIDGKLARSTAQELDDLMTKYPDAQLRSAKSRNPYNFQHSTRYAQTDVYDRKVLSGTEIQFNDSFYMKKADLEKSYAATTVIPEGKRYGYHPPLGEGNDAAKAIAAHEFGHTMDASGSYRAGAAVKDTLRREYLRLNPYTDEQKAVDRVLVANAAKRGITIRQPIETRYEAWLHDSLSEYSFTQSGKLNPSEALAEAFGHAELDPKHITDAERALHKLAVDEHTKPYRRGMVKPDWHMATDAPKAVVDAKEAKRVAAQEKKDAAAAKRKAEDAAKEARATARAEKKAAAEALKAEKAAARAAKEAAEAAHRGPPPGETRKLLPDGKPLPEKAERIAELRRRKPEFVATQASRYEELTYDEKVHGRRWYADQCTAAANHAIDGGHGFLPIQGVAVNVTLSPQTKYDWNTEQAKMYLSRPRGEGYAAIRNMPKDIAPKAMDSNALRADRVSGATTYDEVMDALHEKGEAKKLSNYFRSAWVKGFPDEVPSREEIFTVDTWAVRTMDHTQAEIREALGLAPGTRLTERQESRGEQILSAKKYGTHWEFDVKKDKWVEVPNYRSVDMIGDDYDVFREAGVEAAAKAPLFAGTYESRFNPATGRFETVKTSDELTPWNPEDYQAALWGQIVPAAPDD